MIQIFYGFGKGKTTSAIGAGMRAYGAGLRVLLVQFFKDNKTSELKGLPFEIFEAPNEIAFNPNPDDYLPWINSAIDFVNTSDADVIILDEFLDLIPKYLCVEKAVAVLGNSDKEYVLTGHYVNNQLFDMADYLTFFEKKKHPYDKGVAARKGFEF